MEGDIAAKLLSGVLAHPRVKRLLSTGHFFFVDGTLIKAWASMKRFKPKNGSDESPADGDGRNREADFHGEKRSNDTHEKMQFFHSMLIWVGMGLRPYSSSLEWPRPCRSNRGRHNSNVHPLAVGLIRGHFRRDGDDQAPIRYLLGENANSWHCQDGTF